MRPAISSKTSTLGPDSLKPSNTRLGVSPSKYQSKSMPPSPSPCPGPGSRPVMKPSTETASAVKTFLMVASLAVVVPQPADVVRDGALDVVLRPEAGVLPQPGDVHVVVRGPSGGAPRREGDVRARDGGVDRGDHLAVPHQPPGRDVVGVVVQPTDSPRSSRARA